jgi:hypothetical protein
MLMPGVWGPARHMGFDLPLAAGVSCLAAIVARSDIWFSKFSALRFGILAGSVGLIKGQIVLWVPWLLLPSWVRSRKNKNMLIWIILGMALGGALFWIGNEIQLIILAFSHLAVGEHPRAQLDIELEQLMGPSGRWCYYLCALPGWIGAGSVFALAIAVIGMTLRHSNDTFSRQLTRDLIIFSGLALLAFSSFEVRWVRYILPILPALAVIIALGLTRIQAGPRRCVVFIAISLGIGNEIVASFIPIRLGWLGLPSYCRSPQRSNWQDSIDQAIASSDVSRMQLIGVESDDPEFLPDDIARVALLIRLRLPAAEVMQRTSAHETEHERLQYLRSRYRFDALFIGHQRQLRDIAGWRKTWIGELLPAGEVVDARRWLTLRLR